MIRREIARLVLTGLALGALAAPSFAQERGSFDEAKAMVAKGLAHVKKVGPEAAFKDFTEDKANWNNKDIYLFVLDMKNNTMAHGANAKQVGKNFNEVKDGDGKMLFQEFVAIVNKGGGNFAYAWPHPTSKKMEDKVAYVTKIPNTDYYIGSGAYK